MSDFSDYTRGEFEKYIGKTVTNWPADVLPAGHEHFLPELTAVTNSVTACANECDGYFLFDLCHLKLEPRKWDAVKAGIEQL